MTDAVLKAKLRPASYNQAQITDCSHLVALARRTEMKEDDVDAYVSQMVQERGLEAAKLEGYRNMMVNSIVKGMAVDKQKEWAARQVYIALGKR